jgi:hypothetical protein
MFKVSKSEVEYVVLCIVHLRKLNITEWKLERAHAAVYSPSTLAPNIQFMIKLICHIPTFRNKKRRMTFSVLSIRLQDHDTHMGNAKTSTTSALPHHKHVLYTFISTHVSITLLKRRKQALTHCTYVATQACHLSSLLLTTVTAAKFSYEMWTDRYHSDQNGGYSKFTVQSLMKCNSPRFWL